MDEARRLEYLAEHGIGIVRLLPSTNGALVECLEIDGLPHGPALCIKRRARRRSLNSGIPRCVKPWSAHEATVGFHGEFPNLKRAPWDEADIYDPCQLPAEFDLALNKIAAMLELVRSFPQDKETYGLVHGDVHQ